MADISCEVIRDLLPLYVDDVLSPDSRALVEEHLGTCADCADQYHLLKEPVSSSSPPLVKMSRAGS